MQKQLEKESVAAGISRFKTNLAERLAYKALFVERLTLTELKDQKVGNLQAARENMHTLVSELIDRLQDTGA